MHRLCLHGILQPTKMAPIQSRSIDYLMEFHPSGLMEGNSLRLLRNEYQFCQLIQERLVFQHRQSKAQHDNEKCKADRPSYRHAIYQALL